jgi:hypothetical protein
LAVVFGELGKGIRHVFRQIQGYSGHCSASTCEVDSGHLTPTHAPANPQVVAGYWIKACTRSVGVGRL